MKQFSFVICFIIFSEKMVCAQSLDIGSWNILNLSYNYTEKLNFFGEGQIRSLKFYNQFHYYELKGGVTYKIHNSVKLTLGVGTYQTYKQGGNFERPKNNNEFRLWPQVILTQGINRFKIEQRYRLEMRWTSNGYRNRFRYRFGVLYPFEKEKDGHKPFQANINNEIFFTNNEPYFERNRMQLSLNYKTSKKMTLQIGYLYQFDYKINDETGRDFIVLGFYYELFRKEKSKTEERQELKDY